MGELPANQLVRHKCAYRLVSSLGLGLILLAWVAGLTPAAAGPVEIAGNLAFLADAAGRLKVVDIGNGTNLTLVSTAPEQAEITGIALHGQYAVVSAAQEGIYVFDVSVAPPTLVPNSRFTSFDSAADVKLAGATAFLADGEFGIVVVDFFDPTRPVQLPTLTPPGIVSSIDIKSNRLFAACGDAGVLIADISKVNESEPLAQYATFRAARRVRVAGNYAYVLCDGGRLEIVNIQNPVLPTLAGTFTASGGFADVDVKGPVVALANTNGTLTMLNLANPALPVVQASYVIPNGARGVRLAGANAYVRNNLGNLLVIPLSALQASAPEIQESVPPVLVAAGQRAVLSVLTLGSTPMSFQWHQNGIPLTNSTRISGVTNAWLTISAAVLADTGTYSVVVSNTSGLVVRSNVLTVVNSGAPVWRGSLDPGGSAESIDVQDFMVFVAAGTNGLQKFDAIDARFPIPHAGAAVDGFAAGICVNESYTFIAVDTNGLRVFLASPTELIATTNSAGNTRAIHLDSGLAYVAAGEAGLIVFRVDATSPHPIFVGSYDTPGFARNVFVSDGIAYVADDTNGVQLLSVTNPAAIALLGTYDTPGAARNVKSVAGKTYVADAAGGLVVLDTSNPSTPTLLGSYGAAAPALDLDMAANLVGVACGTNGVVVLDVANPAAIAVLGTNPVAPALALRIEGNALYVAAGTNGVHILELLGYQTFAPQIFVTPSEIIALPGSEISFHASVSATNPVTYQWYQGDKPLFDGPTVHGAGTATLTCTNLTLGDTDDYFVVIRDGWNQLASAGGRLTVVPVGTPVLRGGFFDDADALKVQVVGNVAFVASRLGGLQAIDCRNPQQPVLIGQQPTLGLAQAVRVKGRYAYVASWDAGLEIFDVINPTNLVRVGRCDTPGLARAVQVAGNLAHVADRIGGYSLIDVRNPAQPVVVGTSATMGFAEGVVITGNNALLAAAHAGLEVFNFSNPLAPARIGQLDTPGSAEDISLAATRAYVSDYNSGVCIVEVTNPAAPAVVGHFQTAGDAFQVQVISNRAYIAEGIGKIEVADITNPAAPTLITTSLAGSSVRALHVIGNQAFIADRIDGLLVAELLGMSGIRPAIVDLTGNLNAAAGSEVVLSVAAEGTPPLSYAWRFNGELLTNSAALAGVSQPYLRLPSIAATNAGNYSVLVSNAFGVVTSSVVAVGVQPVGWPVAGNPFDTPGTAAATAVFGNVAYIADGSGGLRLVDLSNPTNLVSPGFYSPTGDVLGLCLQTNLLYLALGPGGVTILDVTQPQPVWVGAFDTPGTAFTLDVSGGRAFVADGSAGLRIFAVTNPASPVALGFLPTAGVTRDTRVNGSLVYLAEGTAGVRIVTATNPAAPVVVGSFPGATFANAIRVSANRAYVANGSAGLLVLDVQNPAAPLLLGSYPTTNALGVELVGNLVLVADGTNGCLVLDAANPASIQLVGSTAVGAGISQATLLGNLALLAAGTNGLRLAELTGVPAQPVAYLTQPTNAAAATGGVAEFRAAPVGTPPLLYRWYHNNLPVIDDARIFGAATPHLVISNVVFTDTGNYQLRVYSPGGTTNSEAAQLVFIGPLQAQLNALTNGAVVALPPGASFSEALVVDRNLTLTGPWWNQPTLNAGGLGPVLRVLPGANVTLQGITLRNGNNAAAGGGVVNEGTLTLDHCLITGNVAASGGGIANFGLLHLTRTSISNNLALNSGGGYYNGPAARAFITNSVFFGNTADQGGGGFNTGTNTLQGTLLANNAAFGAQGNGGAWYQSNGWSRFLNTTVSGNTAATWITHSGVGTGGGVHAAGGRIDFEFATVANNAAAQQGGGVSAANMAIVAARNSVFAGNTAEAAPDFSGTMDSAGYNLVQTVTAELSIIGTSTGNQLSIAAELGPLADNGGPTLTHAPDAASPLIDAGAPPGPAWDGRGLPRPFDIPWIANAAQGWDIGAMEYIDTSLYLVLSNRSPAGFTLAWATNAVLQKSLLPAAGWLDQTNQSPLFVPTTDPMAYFRLHAPVIPVRLITNNETNNGFDLAWPDYGVLERAPTANGPWDPVTATGPVHVNLVPTQNEFFRLRVIQH